MILKIYHMLRYNDKLPIKTPKILKPQYLDISDLPDHSDGVQKSWKPFLIFPLVLRIPKRYYVWGYNGKILIKTSKILQNPSFWPFLTFLIVLMASLGVLPKSQEFQIGIICGGTMKKSPLRHPKSSKTPVFGHS